MGVGATNLFASIKSGLDSQSLLQIGGAVKGVSQAVGGGVQAGQASTEAAGLKVQAKQSAEAILRATAKRQGAARAATAASGVKLDQFSAINENDIVQAGESDAALTILNGGNAARATRSAGNVSFGAGLGTGIDSLMQADISNWKGAKGKPGATSSMLDNRYTDYTNPVA